MAGFERAVLGAHDSADGREVRIDGDWLEEGGGFEAYRPADSELLETSGEFGDDFWGDHFDRNPSALREPSRNVRHQMMLDLT